MLRCTAQRRKPVRVGTQQTKCDCYETTKDEIIKELSTLLVTIQDSELFCFDWIH